MSKKVISCKIDMESLTASWTVEGQGTVQLSANELGEETCRQALMHGIKQVVGDTAAGKTKHEGPEAAMQAISNKIESLKTDGWRKATAGVPRGTSQFVRALARALNMDEDEAQRIHDEREEALGEDEFKDWKKAVRADAAWKKARAEIQAEDAERAKEQAQGESKLGELVQ